MRRATKSITSFVVIVKFQFTPVVRRATDDRNYARKETLFQFTPVVRRATSPFVFFAQSVMFQFTPVVRRATALRARYVGARQVSIHARRATGDLAGVRAVMTDKSFNSRPSCDGRPVLRTCSQSGKGFNSRPSCDGRHYTKQNRPPNKFQFTPVVRRATSPFVFFAQSVMFQFTPVVRRATLYQAKQTTK